MIYDIDIAKQVAKSLLQINAIILQPNQPFKWAAGWNSPIYCDNRKTLSYPKIRNYIRQELAAIVKNHYKGANVIAGVATAGIPHGALVAEELGLPFIYVRSKAKKHGKQKTQSAPHSYPLMWGIWYQNDVIPPTCELPESPPGAHIPLV